MEDGEALPIRSKAGEPPLAGGAPPVPRAGGRNGRTDRAGTARRTIQTKLGVGPRLVDRGGPLRLKPAVAPGVESGESRRLRLPRPSALTESRPPNSLGCDLPSSSRRQQESHSENLRHSSGRRLIGVFTHPITFDLLTKVKGHSGGMSWKKMRYRCLENELTGPAVAGALNVRRSCLPSLRTAWRNPDRS